MAILRLVSLLLLLLSAQGFVTKTLPAFVSSQSSSNSNTRHDVVPEWAASLMTATVDSDIAKMPDNEFAPIFAGGLAVMFGGLLSALVVGFIVDKKDLYASIVADSYAQGADDEDFWKGLSDEEKKKTQELLKRVKGVKEGGQTSVAATTEAQIETRPAEVQMTASRPEPINQETKAEIGMFSDYAD